MLGQLLLNGRVVLLSRGEEIEHVLLSGARAALVIDAEAAIVLEVVSR